MSIIQNLVLSFLTSVRVSSFGISLYNSLDERDRSADPYRRALPEKHRVWRAASGAPGREGQISYCRDGRKPGGLKTKQHLGGTILEVEVPDPCA